MPPKQNSRNWNDVQTAIATVSIVTTLGLWNLFATPSKTKIVQTGEPVIPPTQPPLQAEAATETVPSAAIPAAMPQVKIMFTPGAPQPSIQPVSNVQQSQTVKTKKNKNNGGHNTVTQTKTS
jgi:hypothetical protein